MSNPFEVALAKQLCPICCSEHEVILMNNKLTQKAANEVKEANGKVIGFLEEPCNKCQKYLKDGYIAMVGIDPEKSTLSDDETTVNFAGMYRTGQLGWIKRDVAKEMFFIVDDTPMVVLSEEAFDMIQTKAEKANV